MNCDNDLRFLINTDLSIINGSQSKSNLSSVNESNELDSEDSDVDESKFIIEDDDRDLSIN